MNTIITLGELTRVFVVEDDPDRSNWFIKKLRARLVDIDHDVPRILEKLEQINPNTLDIIFLDHDLGGPYAPPYSVDVARYLARTLYRTWGGAIIIHSLNPGGAANLAGILHDFKVQVIPFGTFDIR